MSRLPRVNGDASDMPPVKPGNTMTGGLGTSPAAAGAREAPTFRTFHPALSALAGAGAAVVGLLPWLITGMRLPLQNLWALDTWPDDMPIALLPFSQYALDLIVVVLVVGSALAGLLARMTRQWSGPWGAPSLFVGLILVQATAIVQTFDAVQGGLEKSSTAENYFAAIAGGTMLAFVVGAAAFWLIARAPRAGALIGFAVSSLALDPWLGRLVVPFDTIPMGAVAQFGVRVYYLLEWLPPLLIGCAIAWCGVRSVGRLAAAGLSLFLLWIMPPLMLAITATAASRALARHPQEMADSALFSFRGALDPLPIVVAVVVAGVVTVVAAAVPRWRSQQESTAVEQ